MKKAVIETGGKQYIVSEGTQFKVELLEEGVTSFQPLAIIDGKDTKVGTPYVEGAKVSFDIVDEEQKQDKVIALRYKAKKRVSTKRGHRQRLAVIKISKIV